MSVFLNGLGIMMALLRSDSYYIFKITKLDHFSILVITLHDTKVGAQGSN